MTNKEIYKIMSVVTGIEIKALQRAREVEIIRPSEVIEIVKNVLEGGKNDDSGN